MRILSQIKMFATFFLFQTILIIQSDAAARTINRIALGLKRNIYLESDMVLYLQTKSCLEDSGRIQRLEELLSAASFENFRKEMIIHEESTRLGSFEASADQMTAAKKNLQGCRSGLEPQVSHFSFNDPLAMGLRGEFTWFLAPLTATENII
jgi:hypothetical protein